MVAASHSAGVLCPVARSGWHRAARAAALALPATPSRSRRENTSTSEAASGPEYRSASKEATKDPTTSTAERNALVVTPVSAVMDPVSQEGVTNGRNGRNRPKKRETEERCRRGAGPGGTGPARCG